ncbi:hypothetical protein M1L60_37455 [Actinoplanes sp. TRM 88003]|uniref:Integral membrane protein n=1 Tax=Paractinoplanes aksuensis TaxID=2939490 RepID=A0ABT1E388_9ACTN|nr:hypothetical protein [Actinoplanes aksuensis]MCO8276281.1 hypothetical protein [Actinoplanes aksuensis]
MAGNGVRSAIRELLQVTAMWFGLGEPDPANGRTPPEQRAAYLFVQTLAAVVLGVTAAIVYLVVKGGPVPAGWPVPYLPLFVPLAIAVARRPATSLWLLAAAVPAGALVTVVVATMIPSTGFWAWFSAVAAGALAAATFFGAVSPRR